MCFLNITGSPCPVQAAQSAEVHTFPKLGVIPSGTAEAQIVTDTPTRRMVDRAHVV